MQAQWHATASSLQCLEGGGGDREAAANPALRCHFARRGGRMPKARCLVELQVREVSENPLANNRGGKFARDQVGPGEETSAMETRILEASISKICSLLAVGFGDAGAEVRPCGSRMTPVHAWNLHACGCARR